jgi:Right handed beta helix region
VRWRGSRLPIIGVIAVCGASLWNTSPSLASSLVLTDPADANGGLDIRTARLISDGSDLRISMTMTRPFRMAALRARAGRRTRTVCLEIGQLHHSGSDSRLCLTRHGTGTEALVRSRTRGGGPARGFVAATVYRASHTAVRITFGYSSIGLRPGTRVTLMVTSVWRGGGVCSGAEPCRDAAPNSGTSMPVACSGLRVTSRQDFLAVVAAAPPGTTFCVMDGDYTVTGTVRPKNNDRFVGVYSDGSQPNISNVGSGPVFSGGQGTFYEGLGIGPSSGIGLQPGGGSIIMGNHIHDNELSGIETVANNLVINGNEIGPNNGTTAALGDASGIKLHGYAGSDSGAYNLVVNNAVHDNIGHGVWSDCDAHDSRFVNNYVSHNAGAGLVDETSYNNAWVGNVVQGNGLTWAAPAVSVRDTIDSFMSHNLFYNNYAGVQVSMDRRATLTLPSPGLGCADSTLTGYVPSGTVVSRNRFIATAPSGFLYDAPNASGFSGNCWSVPSLTGTYWEIPGDSSATWAQWQAAGLDLDGREQTTRC